MKANRGVGLHSDEYKIPIEDRKKFMGNNKSKWVDKKRHRKYIRWVKEGKKPIR